MPSINLQSLFTVEGGFSPTTRGRVTFEYWAGLGPFTDVVADEVRFSAPIVVNLTGEPVSPELLPTGGKCCVKVTVEDNANRRYIEDKYVEIPDVTAVDFGDLIDVDPTTYLPSEDGQAAWDAAVAAAAGFLADGQAAAVSSATSASAASEAATAADEAAQTALTVAGEVGPARDVAVQAAQDAGEALTGAVSAKAAAVAAAASVNPGVAGGTATLDGGARLPEAQVPERLSAASLGARFARRRLYDVRDFMGSDDIGAAVNRAIEAAGMDAYTYGRPGQVILPPGEFAQATEISWFMTSGATAHGVDLIGSDRGTVLVPQGSIAAIHHISPTGAQALSDVMIANFEIDGADQVNPAGGYQTKVKGTYMQRLRRVKINNLYIHDVIATGLGNDFHDDCEIHSVTVENCGRGNNGAQGGGAGIGIGTGVWVTESLVVSNCTTRGNKRDGLFFETQNPMWPVGTRVIGHYSERNGGAGIEDGGCTGLTVQGGLLRKNAVGFKLGAGTISPGAPGMYGIVQGVDITENTTGVLVDNTVRQPPATQTGFELDGTAVVIPSPGMNYTFDRCNIRNNTGDGFRASTATATADGLSIDGCRIHGNGLAGINLATTGAGGFKNLKIGACRIENNGTDTTASDSQRAGLRTTAPVESLRMYGNIIGDNRTAGQTQRTGFYLGAALTGSCDFQNNDLRGNTVAPVTIGSGSYGTGVRIGDNPGWTNGPGTPEGVVVAPRGTVYRRSDGASADQVLYVKNSASGNTGWVALT